MELLDQRVLRLLILIQKVLNNLALLISGISPYFCTNYIVFILSHGGGARGRKQRWQNVHWLLVILIFSSIFGIGNQGDLSARSSLSLTGCVTLNKFLILPKPVVWFLKWHYGPKWSFVWLTNKIAYESTQH